MGFSWVFSVSFREGILFFIHLDVPIPPRYSRPLKHRTFQADESEWNVFDSSYGRGSPTTFAPNQVAPVIFVFFSYDGWIRGTKGLFFLFI